MGALERNNVQVIGSGSSTRVFAHGFGCDQTMWRLPAPGFVERIALRDCDEVITEFVRGFET